MLSAKPLPRPDDLYPVRRALISVFDKTGLEDFARRLHDLGVTLISTGGTARTLRDAGLSVIDVTSLTGFPEILDGRVKTLHPIIHGGLLARRNDQDDLAAVAELNIEPIDLVVVNLYPFERATARAGADDAEAVENIDIGGPTMIRAAAKNFFFVGSVTSPGQYDAVADELERNGGALSLVTRRRLAAEAFTHSANYDQAITNYFGRSVAGTYPGGGPTISPGPVESVGADRGGLEAAIALKIHAERAEVLRYGENPHQLAGLYGRPTTFYEQLHGKDLSFNNILDLSAALFLIDEFTDAGPTCAILKHTNPCGVATAGTLEAAYQRAFATDRQSPFGGIVVVNRALNRATAEAINEIFTEIVIAPAFDDGVLDFLKQKQNRRVIRILQRARQDAAPDVRSVLGGFLVQERDGPLPGAAALRDGWTVVTSRQPSDQEWIDLDFAWRVAKHVKSNAIVYAAAGSTIGIGAGQMSRVDASEIALLKGRKAGLNFAESVVASDAFFPFADGLIAAAESGAGAVVQPGGSVRDEDVIQAANEHNVAMVFTGTRHFRH